MGLSPILTSYPQAVSRHAGVRSRSSSYLPMLWPKITKIAAKFHLRTVRRVYIVSAAVGAAPQLHDEFAKYAPLLPGKHLWQDINTSEARVEAEQAGHLLFTDMVLANAPTLPGEEQEKAPAGGTGLGTESRGGVSVQPIVTPKVLNI
jgi:hypothetical protein